MANIIFVAPVESYSQREVPPFSKLNAQIVSKINTIRDNTVIINTGLETLLQGAAGGSEQANIPFALSSAPTGWTRDLTFSTDRALRITDGVTGTSGANPNNTGGGEGGDWQIIGSSSGLSPDHQHDLQNHKHNIGTHTHTITGHTHTDLHTHQQVSHTHPDDLQAPTLSSNLIEPFALVGATSPDVTVATRAHTHTTPNHNHGLASNGDGTTSIPSDGTTGISTGGISDAAVSENAGASPDLTSNSGGHLHTVNHGTSWRPKYLNIIMCKKD